MAPLHASGARPHYASIVDPLPTPSASSSGGASVFGLAAAAAALLGLCAVWAAAPSTAPAPQGLFQATAVRTAPASLAAVAPQWDRCAPPLQQRPAALGPKGSGLCFWCHFLWRRSEGGAARG